MRLFVASLPKYPRSSASRFMSLNPGPGTRQRPKRALFLSSMLVPASSRFEHGPKLLSLSLTPWAPGPLEGPPKRSRSFQESGRRPKSTASTHLRRAPSVSSAASCWICLQTLGKHVPKGNLIWTAVGCHMHCSARILGFSEGSQEINRAPKAEAHHPKKNRRVSVSCCRGKDV